MRPHLSNHRLALVQIVLSVAGMGVAAVLTSFHYSPATTAALCTTAGGCETVNSSPYSTIAGIPIAIFGLLGYLAIGLAAFASTREGRLGEQAPLAVFGMALVGVLYSLYLTYLELFVIRAVCPWCVASAVVMAAIWIVSILDVTRRRRDEFAESDAQSVES